MQVFYPINLQPKLIPWRYWAPCVPAFFARISLKMLTMMCLDYSFYVSIYCCARKQLVCQARCSCTHVSQVAQFCTRQMLSDNMDSAATREVAYARTHSCFYIREKMEDTLGQSIAHMRRDAKNDLTHSSLNIHQNILPYCSKILGRYVGVVGSKISSFIASGI